MYQKKTQPVNHTQHQPLKPIKSIIQWWKLCYSYIWDTSISQMTKFNAMNIHGHEYGLLCLIFSLHLQMSCVQHWLCFNQEFWEGTNSPIQWQHGYTKKTPTVFYCKITFPRLYSLLQCLHSLAFLNHFYLCIYKYTDICMLLQKWSFFSRTRCNKITNFSFLIIKNQTSPLIFLLPATCTLLSRKKIHSIWRAKQSLFHRAARMWGGNGFTMAVWTTPTYLMFREHLQLSWYCSLFSIVCTS